MMFQLEKDCLGYNYFLINLTKHHLRNDSSKHFQKIQQLNIGRSITFMQCVIFTLLFTHLIESEFVSSLVMIRLPCSSQQKLKLEEPLK